MIFLTVGTQLPFDRLTRVVDAWAAGHPEVEVLGQIGPALEQPRHLKAVGFIPPAEIQAIYDRAHLIIAHAGMGTILSACVRGKPIIIFPRRAELNEHRNNHQIATALQFSARKGIYVAFEEHEVYALLNKHMELVSGEKIPTFAPDYFIRTIKELIDS